MARPSKYETHVQPKLIQVAAWARDGLTLEDIAHNLDIAKSTLCDYQNLYSELSDALKVNKELADLRVENALYKRAMGYDYQEETLEPLYNMASGEAILDEYGKPKIVVTKIVRKQVAPDTTAQIFWLKNRKQKEWRDKQDIDLSVKEMPEIIIKRAD